MEAAPLTLAHRHARNAALETQRSNPVAASEEHDLAAAEFATAASTSSDSEALRILNLLEQHHKKLGLILKSRHEHPSQDAVPAGSTLTRNDPTTASTPQQRVQEPERYASAESTTLPTHPAQGPRGPARDLSSSIASNLASARGIPGHRQKRSTPISPLVSSQHADGKFTQDVRPRSSLSKPTADARPSWAPPTLSESTVESPSLNQNDQTASISSDAPFQQFYSTFESLISKISAPLAFAGLPLTTKEPTPSAAQQPPVTKSKPQPKAEPAPPAVNYSQLISRAALRAVRETGGNPSESFYIVQPSGGTISYADIMTMLDREERRAVRDGQQRSAANTLAAAGRFKDAGGSEGPRSNPGDKTLEELNLENDAMRRLVDMLSKRVHAFETSAQMSSAALAQSIRSLQHSPLSTPDNSRGRGPVSRSDADSTTRKIAQLEEVARKNEAEAKKRKEENLKLRDTLSKYKVKWDNLKAGAKARRERERSESTPAGSLPPTPSVDARNEDPMDGV